MQWEYARLVQRSEVPFHTTVGGTETFIFYGPERPVEVAANDAMDLLNWLGREEHWELVTVETKYPTGMTNAGVT
jgi:hypothetical protein